MSINIGQQYCSSCGQKIEAEVFEAQRDHGSFTEGADCRDCLERVPTEPQMTQLFEEIRKGLSPENREKWEGGTQEDKVIFAMHLIKEGVAEGGSVGFHEQLRKYGCLLLMDRKDRDEVA